MNSYRRILVIRTDRIGDVVLSLPVVTALRRKYPEAYLAMLIQPAVREIIENHPDLNKVLLDEEKTAGIKGLLSLIRNLRSERFNVALVLHPTLRLAVAIAMANIPVRVGTGYRFYSFLFNQRVWEHRKNSLRHEVEYNLSLAEKLSTNVSEVTFRFPVSPAASRSVKEFLGRIGIKEKKPLILLHPGTRGSALEWSRKRFAQLADRLTKGLKAQVLVTGGKGEEAVVKEVLAETSEKVWKAVGCLNLKELAALLKMADLLIANSTGPLHIGVAVGTEVIGIFPPIIPASVRRWGPYRHTESTLTPNIPECRQCSGQKCFRWNCMDMISVDEVWHLARKKLKSKK